MIVLCSVSLIAGCAVSIIHRVRNTYDFEVKKKVSLLGQ